VGREASSDVRSRLTAGEEFVRFFEGSMNQGLFTDRTPPENREMQVK